MGLEGVLDGFQGKKVAVIGDVMLDRYFWGSVSRISPEAPVPVCLIQSESEQLGGAANVANNILALGAKPYLFGAIGDDEAGAAVLGLLEKNGLFREGLVREPGRTTTVKLRIIAEDQHVVRVDRETTAPIAAATRARILDLFCELSDIFDAVIFQDYNKGVLGEELIGALLRRARERAKPIAVDPKFDNFFAYQGVSLFKPNILELGRIVEKKVTPENEAEVVDSVLSRLGAAALLLTKGKKGMSLYQPNRPAEHIPAFTVEVYDVSGAGDTVIATFALALAAGAGYYEGMLLSNHAAAVACAKIGAQPVSAAEVRAALRQNRR